MNAMNKMIIPNHSYHLIVCGCEDLKHIIQYSLFQTIYYKICQIINNQYAKRLTLKGVD